jgi:hypothetical protein
MKRLGWEYLQLLFDSWLKTQVYFVSTPVEDVFDIELKLVFDVICFTLK